jgi:ABC-type Fe3+/spermidine/putrescine transport system ATPase subunit
MVSVQLVNVTKRFGEIVAADNVTLNIDEGEFFTLLGPSGCGKTTTLRLIAGFYTPDQGQILFGNRVMNLVPPFKRNTGMVFQNYAIFPHMDVFNNVAYGLKIRRMKSEVLRKRVLKTLELVKMNGLEKRLPSQLSGGQQQRIALARALVIEPDVLLFDEPLSNLDAKLRIEMRTEIRRIQKELKITSIYVTHDQEEALSISDRIAVQRNGTIQQVGTPKQVYTNPENPFVADFIGQCSFIYGTVKGVNHYVVVESDVGVKLRALKTFDLKVGQSVLCAIRPENFLIKKPEEECNVLESEVVNVLFLGKSNSVHAKVGDLRIAAELPTGVTVASGDRITLYVKVGETTVLPFTA